MSSAKYKDPSSGLEYFWKLISLLQNPNPCQNVERKMKNPYDHLLEWGTKPPVMCRNTRHLHKICGAWWHFVKLAWLGYFFFFLILGRKRGHCFGELGFAKWRIYLWRTIAVNLLIRFVLTVLETVWFHSLWTFT